jgi:hypothetical protein
MASKLIEDFTEHVQPLVPGYKVVRKSQSRLMKFLGKILFFTPNFMTRFTTTCGNVVYVTDDLWKDNSAWALSTLAHEARHVYDKRRFGMILFGFAYLLPQILAPLALLSLLAIWFSNAWLWSLTALAFLAPVPALFRMRIERQGYLMSLCVVWWTFGEEMAHSQIPHCLKQFTGPAYYFMWPFKKHMIRWFEKELPEKATHPSRYNATFVLVFDFINSTKYTGGRTK